MSLFQWEADVGVSMLLHKAAENSKWYFTAKRPNPRADLGQLHSQPLIRPFEDGQRVHLKCPIINDVTVIYINSPKIGEKKAKQ